MKNGNIGDFGVPSSEELLEINKYTRRKFDANEVYAFSVVLCDNDIDRDFERFTDESLEKLAELFVGKTGIFDHSHKAENQCARIFSCHVETVEDKKNRLGKPYKRLFARAYMPKSAASEELILSIESGIKKEVSVGCSMAQAHCSICGQPAGACEHRKGKTYRKNGGRALCFFELSAPTDAYEWSFVAVPAQKKAGVVKSYFDKKEFTFGDIKKSASEDEVTFSVDEAIRLSQYIVSLQKSADLAGEFLQGKKQEIVKMFMPSVNSSAAEMFLKALDRLEPEELFKLYSEGERLDDIAMPQLSKRKEQKQNNKSNSFFIV